MNTLEEMTFLSSEMQLEMVSLFGQSPTEICLILTLDFIYQCHHRRIESWNVYVLQCPYLQSYADAVAEKRWTLV